MSEEQQSFAEKYLSQFEGLQRIVMEGVENLGNVTLALGEAAANGLGAIASLVGLGGAASSLASTGSGNKSNAQSMVSAPPVPNIPTTPEIAPPSLEIQKVRAAEMVNRLPPEALAAINSIRDTTPNYGDGNMAHAGIEAHSTSPTLVAAAGISQTARTI